jgi:predicted DCC family thiol-disulfide oxidoreductase YuxK
MANGIVIFDGACGFCNMTLLYLAKKDKKNNFIFVSNLSDKGRQLIEDKKMEQLTTKSIIVLYEEKVYTKGEAVKFLISKIPAFKGLFFIKYIPRVILNMFYTLISKNRYIFGKNSCELPSFDIRSKFVM